MVQVNPSSVANTIKVNSQISNSVVKAGTPSLYYVLSRDWAVSTTLVENIDYSSKYYAGKSKEYCFTILNDAGFIAVRDDLTNIDTVGTYISSVNTVGSNISSVNAVAYNLSSIESVLENSTNINAVAANMTDINAIAYNLPNINAAVDNATNINAVAYNLPYVVSVAGDLTSINSVAAISSNITTVAGISSDVSTVASISSDVTAVAGIGIMRITTVSNNAIPIIACSNHIDNINTCGNDLIIPPNSNIKKCADNITNINTCAQNIGTIASKANNSLDNLSDTGKLMAGAFGMPYAFTISPLPYAYNTSGGSGAEYTAIFNGYIIATALITAADYLALRNSNVAGFTSIVTGQAGYITCCMPIASGQKFTFDYSSGVSSMSLYLFPVFGNIGA